MNPDVLEKIKFKIDTIFEKIKGFREHLHENPELSFKEYNTMAFVAEQLEQIGIPFEKNIAGTGIVGLIRANHHLENTSCIGLRADLDALPIKEENEVTYKSKIEGVMHACGHDVHTSILLGVAEILYEFKNQLDKPIKLIFQPGEEMNPGGASLMIQAGVLENPSVERMYGLHVFPELNAGLVGLKSGLYMASSDEIHVSIEGVGGHGALPEKCINPIVMGSEFVLEAQRLIYQNCPKNIPVVLSFGRFEALGATNVIPSGAEIKGTFRTMNEQWRFKAHNLLNDLAIQIEKKYGGDINLHISKGYPFLVNSEELTSSLKLKLQKAMGPDHVKDLSIRMTAEDFAFYSQKIPVCFFRLGTGKVDASQNFGVHHPKFDIDSEALKTGMLAMTLAAFE